MATKYIKDSQRPTLAEANDMLAKLGWTPSAGCWEDENRVFAFSVESYQGTYGGAAASVCWSSNGAYLHLPERKPKHVRFV